MYKIMTAGPTQVRENVRMARSLECTNPDLDPAFFDFYKETCEMLSKAMHTENKALILGGEGILGLEAACASLTEPGDRVLVIDNGVFGKGFADFVKIYGGEPVSFVSDYHRPVELSELEAFLQKDNNLSESQSAYSSESVNCNSHNVTSLVNFIIVFFYLSSITAIPGSTFPSRNSRDAPPPVEI